MEKLTRREEELMRCFWEHGPLFVRELVALAAEPKHHFNTLSTMVRALEAKGWVEREHSKTDRRRVHVIVTDKGFQDLEIKRREFEDRTAAFLEQLGETDTQEMVRLLRRANEIIDRNQERRDAE